MCMPSIKLPHAKFNTNFTSQSYVFLYFNMTMTVIQKVKTHLEQSVYLLLHECTRKLEKHAKIRSIF